MNPFHAVWLNGSILKIVVTTRSTGDLSRTVLKRMGANVCLILGSVAQVVTVSALEEIAVLGPSHQSRRCTRFLQ